MIRKKSHCKLSSLTSLFLKLSGAFEQLAKSQILLLFCYTDLRYLLHNCIQKSGVVTYKFKHSFTLVDG